MTISRMVLLQKATRNLLKDASFINRWVPLNTIKKGLEIRYKFNKTYPITKLTLSRSINQIEQMIENLEYTVGLLIARQFGLNFTPQFFLRPTYHLLSCLDGISGSAEA